MEEQQGSEQRYQIGARPAEFWKLEFMTGLDFHVLSFPYLPTVLEADVK